MTEMVIGKGFIIDDVESVICGINEMSGRKISDLGSVKKFINTEKNTIFYLDSSLNSSMQENQNSVYAWLDTGYTDCWGKPILISLLRTHGEFVGHVVGTVHSLAESAKNYFYLKKNLVDQRVRTFKKKYDSKVNERKISHIVDEQKFLMDCCNSRDAGECISPFAEKLMALELEFEEEAEEEEVIIIAEPQEEEQFSEMEEEITVSILLEQMESMQAYMDELVEMLENVNQESQAQIQKSQAEIQALQAKNDEYKRAIVQMRSFVEQEEAETSCKPQEEKPGHELLGKHNKILVLGVTELGTNVMQGIAKNYGFEKNDFVFVDYDKSKSYTDRVRQEGKYRAIIVGACPHKTAKSRGYSSVVEMFKREEGMPYTIDARSKSGALKVTKDSFREALKGVCTNLRMAS